MHPAPREQIFMRILPRTGVLIAALPRVAGGPVAGVALPAGAASPLRSQGRPTTASSAENATVGASNATDGNAGTRWSSAFSDPQWIQVDLGATATVSQVVLQWEAAYASAFQLQVSADAATWTTVYSTTTGTGGTQTIDVSGTGRYLRVLGTARATPYGYSLFELAVRTTGGGGGGTIPGGGPLGPNVIVFDPSMSGAAIQSKVDSVFAQQERNQFGSERFALLFKPGTYGGFNAPIGFYTPLARPGQNPDDVRVQRGATGGAGGGHGHPPQNVSRSAGDQCPYPSGR